MQPQVSQKIPGVNGRQTAKKPDKKQGKLQFYLTIEWSILQVRHGKNHYERVAAGVTMQNSLIKSGCQRGGVPLISEMQFNTEGRFHPDRKALLTMALSPVQEELSGLRKALKNLVPTNTRGARLVTDHVLSGEGKLIRPAIFLMCCRLTGYQGPHLIRVASVCEFVHTASLLHDDVVDNSPLRRNKPTANKIWGDETAVLAGDLIYSTASELMADTGKLDLVRTFARAIRSMSEGELLHLEELFSADMTKEQYFRILSGKTAVLMGASCKSAAILADSDEEQRSALEVFGHDLGIAFQLTDDALDYLASECQTGKKTLSDLMEGKITLPVILLWDEATEDEVGQIRGILRGKSVTPSDISFISRLTDKYHTAEKTLEIARSYTSRALQALEGNFPDSPARAHLIGLSQTLLLRSF